MSNNSRCIHYQDLKENVDVAVGSTTALVKDVVVLWPESVDVWDDHRTILIEIHKRLWEKTQGGTIVTPTNQTGSRST